MCNISKSAFYIFAVFFIFLFFVFEEAYLNNHKTNDLEFLNVEMFCYRIGNRSIVNPCSSCTTDHYLSQQCNMNEDN